MKSNVQELVVRQAEISLEELAELQAKRELAPSTMIDDICKAVKESELVDELMQDFGEDDTNHLVSLIQQQIMRISRASIQERRELDDEIEIASSNAKALVIATGATVKFAGLTASFRKGRRYLDQAYVKEQLTAHGEDPNDDIFYKIGRPSCSIKTRK